MADGACARKSRSKNIQKSRDLPVQLAVGGLLERQVRAVARILARDGWAALNTNAVARIAGVSIGSVYEYFENKEDILDVILCDRIDQIRSRAIALLAGLLRGTVERPELKATLMIDAADALTHKWFVDEHGVPAGPDEMTQELQRMLHSYVKEWSWPVFARSGYAA